MINFITSDDFIHALFLYVCANKSYIPAKCHKDFNDNTSDDRTSDDVKLQIIKKHFPQIYKGREEYCDEGQEAVLAMALLLGQVKDLYAADNHISTVIVKTDYFNFSLRLARDVLKTTVTTIIQSGIHISTNTKESKSTEMIHILEDYSFKDGDITYTLKGKS